MVLGWSWVSSCGMYVIVTERKKEEIRVKCVLFSAVLFSFFLSLSSLLSCCSLSLALLLSFCHSLSLYHSLSLSLFLSVTLSLSISVTHSVTLFLSLSTPPLFCPVHPFLFVSLPLLSHFNWFFFLSLTRWSPALSRRMAMSSVWLWRLPCVTAKTHLWVVRWESQPTKATWASTRSVTVLPVDLMKKSVSSPILLVIFGWSKNCGIPLLRWCEKSSESGL